MTDLTAQFSHEGNNTWLLKLTGKVEGHNHHLMWGFDNPEALLNQLIAVQARILVIDLSGVERIDSEGLRRLFMVRQEFARKKIQIVLRNPNEHLYHLLRIMQFNRIFIIEFTTN
jgi:anti-anti-sigma factor